MTRFAVIVIAILLSSCTSVPLGTMLELRSFGKDDFIKIQPQDLRAKIQVDEPVRADIDSAELTLELTTEKGLREFKFPLLLVDELNIEPMTGLFSKSAGKTEYILKLSNEAVKNFIATQQIIRDEQSGRLSFSVATGFEKFPSEITEIGLSVFLKLFEEKDFITLFDNAKVEIKHEG
ncbi:hypothetical protein SAMN06297280_0543 [Arsukibacterium tuosuense]|uniref:Lipoprotein n=1 Tax=Arsukibacterium tuosuense TaxID=1323745 RepID=A0A285I579_9GAMM|nr:hypothetical protein [Arsukibacterium tuosuense]SNY43172.1 hypothetical protein SAMN06297280_0543 [Arsukibacterium tuosuense]